MGESRVIFQTVTCDGSNEYAFWIVPHAVTGTNTNDPAPNGRGNYELINGEYF